MSNVRTSNKTGFIRRNGVLRRETVWFGIERTDATTAASATAVLSGSYNAPALELRPFTIVRTRLRYFVRSDQAAATEQFTGNLGMCVVSDQAIAVGVTAVPTPATDISSDLWFLHEIWIGQFRLDGTDYQAGLEGREVDSKAMRKVDIGQDLAITVEAGIGGLGSITTYAGRQLVKLH